MTRWVDRLDRRLSDRARDGLVVLCALLAIGIYWTVWVHYFQLHTVTRYVAAAPGATVTENGQSTRVLSLTRTQTLVSDSAGGEPQTAPPGAEYVVAELEVTVDRDTDYPTCGLLLVGPDDRVWEESSPLDVSRDQSSCSDFRAGVTTRVEVVYEVPTRYADGLCGLALVDPAVTDPALVLTPAR